MSAAVVRIVSEAAALAPLIVIVVCTMALLEVRSVKVLRVQNIVSLLAVILIVLGIAILGAAARLTLIPSAVKVPLGLLELPAEFQPQFWSAARMCLVRICLSYLFCYVYYCWFSVYPC